MAILTIMDGTGKGMTSEFDHVLIIGRGSESDMRIENPALSRKHAVVSDHGTSVLVEDLDSTNGVFVAGTRVPKAKLRNGDEFTIGDSVIRVTIDDSSAISHTRILKAKH